MTDLRTRNQARTGPQLEIEEDRAFWRTQIGDELPIWCGRPERGLRTSPDGYWAIGGTLVLSVLTLAYFAIFTGNDLMWLIGPLVLAANALAGSLALLRAWLDRNNRHARRYAITPRRALAIRNIHSDRVRTLPFTANTKILRYDEPEHARGQFKIRDDTDNYVVLALANQEPDGEVTGSIQFERLTSRQVDEIVGILKLNGLPS